LEPKLIINIECLDGRYANLNICISKLVLDSYEYIPVAMQF